MAVACSVTEVGSYISAAQQAGTLAGYGGCTGIVNDDCLGSGSDHCNADAVLPLQQVYTSFRPMESGP